MPVRKRVWILSSVALFAIAGCHGHADLPTPQHLTLDRMDESLQDPRAHFTDMADNALLHDMSLADLHFVPHTAELNGTGAARLCRMAPLLNTYGGTIRFETMLKDEAMIKHRLDHAREYLSLHGCDVQKVQLKTMLAGGRGMPGIEAVRVELEGPLNDHDKGKGATSRIKAPTGQDSGR